MSPFATLSEPLLPAGLEHDEDNNAATERIKKKDFFIKLIVDIVGFSYIFAQIKCKISASFTNLQVNIQKISISQVSNKIFGFVYEGCSLYDKFV